MRNSSLLWMAVIAFPLSVPTTASAETYPEYLERLRDICAVECLQPKQFQRTARKRGSKPQDDMAIIMDVVDVRQVGDKYELHNTRVEISSLVEREILGSAGIDTSFGSGVGGRTRNRASGRSPSVIIVELDRETFEDILNTGALLAPEFDHDEGEDEIVVEADREREVLKPTFARVKSYFRNRRVVVRGQTRLTPVWIGARLDRRRKQVTLELDNADDIALLPKYDDDGNPVFVDPLNE